MSEYSVDASFTESMVAGTDEEVHFWVQVLGALANGAHFFFLVISKIGGNGFTAVRFYKKEQIIN